MKESVIATSIDPRTEPAAFVGRFQQSLWLWARVLGCDEAGADDLTQEVLIKAIEAARAGQLEVRSDGETMAWLRTSAKHLYLSHKRKQHRRQEILQADAAEVIWQRTIGDEASGEEHWLAALADCLVKLRASEGRLAEIIDLHYQRGLSGDEIAEALSISATNVFTLMHRARATLRGCVERAMRHD